MAKKRKKPANPFGIADDNEFLASRQTHVCTRLAEDASKVFQLYARWSNDVTRQLAAWARQHRAHFNISQ